MQERRLTLNKSDDERGLYLMASTPVDPMRARATLKVPVQYWENHLSPAVRPNLTPPPSRSHFDRNLYGDLL